jgi:hypothetical protein
MYLPKSSATMNKTFLNFSLRIEPNNEQKIKINRKILLNMFFFIIYLKIISFTSNLIKSL